MSYPMVRKVDMLVEIDIFSGRPNPEWRLTQGESSDLMARLEALPPGEPSAWPEGVLGYRGLRLRVLPTQPRAQESPQANSIVAVDVGGGKVLATHADGSVSHLRDRNQKLECWLLTLAHDRVDERTRQAALAGLTGPCP